MKKKLDENKTEAYNVLTIIRSLYQVERSIRKQEATLEERRTIPSEKA